jgi:hypothetical protein
VEEEGVLDSNRSAKAVTFDIVNNGQISTTAFHAVDDGRISVFTVLGLGWRHQWCSLVSMNFSLLPLGKQRRKQFQCIVANSLNTLCKIG